MKTVFFTMNRDLNRAELLTGSIFNCWEMVQSAFAVGIQMSDGNRANAIGRVHSIEEFCRKANYSKTTIIMPEENPFKLEIWVNRNKSEVAYDVWRSWSGPRFLNGFQCDGQRFVWLSDKVYAGNVQNEIPDYCPACGDESAHCSCEPFQRLPSGAVLP